ncbi:unnamed protein product [Periconia digitata]|uniref:Uncharacterized protein n=1 Tax=Periconia digitata TaxID=1303443 RepID=A0A9W4U4T2_9PLEO|nr:unnamed protein product [Periconia digitata]
MPSAMKASTGSSHVPKEKKAHKRKKRSKRSRAIFSCTHVTMERISAGSHAHCSLCGRVPSIGFLYECRQDWDFGSPYQGIHPEKTLEEVGPKSKTRQELERIGLSESIIIAAECGQYTDAQLNHLKKLKLSLNESVSSISQAYGSTDAGKQMATTDGAASTTYAPDPIQCHFRACHNCRPYYSIRTYTSFDAAFANELKPITPSESAILPTKSAKILGGITIDSSSPLLPPFNPSPSLPPTVVHGGSNTATSRPASESGSILTFRTTQTDIDNINSARHNRRRFYSLGHSSSNYIVRDISNSPLLQGLKAAFQNAFRSSRDSSSSGSNITLPMPRTGTARQLGNDSPVGEFDMRALRRVQSQAEGHESRYTMDMAPFQGGARAGYGHELTPAFRDRDGVEPNDDDDLTMYSNASKGDAIEVDGGVAFTEEAVETQTPDVIIDTLLPSFASPLFEDPSAGPENEEIDFESIMAQA